MLDDKTLEALDAAEKAATRGDWKAKPDGHPKEILSNSLPRRESLIAECFEQTNVETEANAAFIALARNHMRDLIDELKYLREESRGLCGPRRRIALAEENEKLRAELADAHGGLWNKINRDNEHLRAELQAARDALVYYSARENWIKTVHGEWFTDENGECGSYARKAIKRIDESGLLK